MKERQYLHVTVKRNDGLDYPNPLRLDEVHLIKALLRHPGNVEAIVTLETCTQKHYERLFG